MTAIKRARLAIGLAMAFGLVACGPDDETDASAGPTGTIEASEAASASEQPSASVSATDGVAGEETSVFDLEQGDCFSATGEEVETVTVVDCEASHIYEVFAIFDHEAGADDPYPGDQELLEYADAACQPYFEDYVGTDYDASRYWITSVTPSQQTWEERDDREIVCTLKLGEEAEETTGSAEGTGQ